MVLNSFENYNINLLAKTAWMHDQSFIIHLEHKNQKLEISLYEKNCLFFQGNQITGDFSDFEVNAIKALKFEDLLVISFAQKSHSKLAFFSRSNGKVYLIKQTSIKGRVIQIQELNNRLLLLLNNGRLIWFDLEFKLDIYA